MTHSLRGKFAGALIAILGLAFGANSAFAGVVDSLKFNPDEYGRGDLVIPFNNPNYGTVFTPTSSVDVTQMSMQICAIAGATFDQIDVYHILTDWNGGAPDLSSYSNYENVGSFAFDIPMCDNEISIPATTTSSVIDPAMQLVAGEHYFFHTNEGIDFLYRYAFTGYIFGVTSGGVQNLAICAQEYNGICGTTMVVQSDFGYALSFDFSTFSTPTQGECGITNLYACFVNAMTFVFVPSDASINQFTTLKDDLKDHAPFGYFTSAVDSINGLEGSTTPEFALATSTPIMTYIFSPLRTGLVWLLSFASLIWLYKKLTAIVI